MLQIVEATCSVEHIRDSVEPLLGEFGVDLVLSGHIHAYARTCAVYEEQCVKHERLGTVHVTLGKLSRLNVQDKMLFLNRAWGMTKSTAAYQSVIYIQGNDPRGR